MVDCLPQLRAILFFLREKMLSFNDAIDCKVDVVAVVHEWYMSTKHWRNYSDRVGVHGGTNYCFKYYLDQCLRYPNQTLQQIQ
jgi:hypothetical protein